MKKTGSTDDCSEGGKQLFSDVWCETTNGRVHEENLVWGSLSLGILKPYPTTSVRLPGFFILLPLVFSQPITYQSSRPISIFTLKAPYCIYIIIPDFFFFFLLSMFLCRTPSYSVDYWLLSCGMFVLSQSNVVFTLKPLFFLTTSAPAVSSLDYDTRWQAEGEGADKLCRGGAVPCTCWPALICTAH